MKQTLTRIILIVASIAIAVGFWSCEDRIDYPDGFYEEGISTIDVDLAFKDFTPALGESRSSGRAMKAIDELWFVIYDGNRNFVEKRLITPDSIKIVENERPDGAVSSETKTGHASVKLTIPNGHYYIYAVANQDLEDADVSTIQKLKALPLKWKSEYSNDSTWQSPNAQMLGGFKPLAKKDNKDSEAEKVTISSSSTKIHAWLTRAASKLTIAFDTRNLSDDVRIYLKSVQIKDIPEYCPLGMENSPGQDNMESYEHNNLTKDQRNSLIDGEIMYFGTAKETDDPKTQHSGWRIIASGDSIYGLYSESKKVSTRGMDAEKRLNLEHSEKAPALYFYENCQPPGERGKESDKRQDVDGNNKEVSFPDGIDPKDKAWKDARPFGSYVEVKGYYENEGKARPGKGEITYRFMLGKDTEIDYDAERNHHYRLTMKFNGYANDVDFHIDYREEAKPGLHVQDTTYVSYLYNQECHTTVRATPREGYDLLSLESYIVDNEWRPQGVPEGEDAMYNKDAWDWQIGFSDSYVSTAGGYTRPDLTVTWTDFKGNKNSFGAENNIEFGYLSLRKTRTNLYELNGSDAKKTFVASMRKLFFDSNPSGSETYNKDHSKGYRNYGAMPGNDGTKPGGDDTDGKYSVTRKTNKLNGSVDYTMEVPLYTRARSIDSWAVYSGANPFYRHSRYARVVFVATYKKNDDSKPGPKEYQEIGQTHVLQAYRIDNPRGIYRRRTNKDPFNVVLLYNKKTATEQQDTYIDEKEVIYEKITSRGPWTVTIEKDPHNLVKIQANGITITGEGKSISGRSNTPVVFTYTPNATPSEGDCYGAIIFVKYHNNSCTHRIIVRQGYDAHEIGEGQTVNGVKQTVKWSAFNVYDSISLTKSPLSVGSIFRTVKDLGYAIKESNNLRKGYGVNNNSLAESDNSLLPGALWIHHKDSLLWDNIPSMTSVPTVKGSITWQLKNYVHNNNYTYRLPDYSELSDIGIYSNKSNIDPDEEAKVLKIGQAFGICYADGAKGVLYTKNAYSYYDPENKGEDTDKGVRGVVIYSQENGDNVFFPFGSLGHPRRRDNGRLQYGSVNWKLKGGANNYRPMAYDLLHQVGGAYWITGSNASNHAAIDYNGGNYMGSYLNKGDVFKTGGHSDALPIKPIVVSNDAITAP